MSPVEWPVATLDPVRRARVLAARVPGGFTETVLDAPYRRVWNLLSDLERSVPAFDVQVDDLRIRWRRPSADGRAEDLRFTSYYRRVPFPFTARLEDGFCLMRGFLRGYFVVMAATPEGPERTRYAQIEAIPLPGGRLLRPWAQRDVRRDVDGIRRLLADGTG